MPRSFKHATATEEKQEGTQKSIPQFMSIISIVTIQSDSFSITATSTAWDVSQSNL